MHAYLIMAHNEQDLLCKLLCALDNENNCLFLHLDKKFKADIEKIKSCVKKSKLVFTKRFNIKWGSFEMVKCELEMLKTALNEQKFEYIHLLSGCDIPLKSQEKIYAFFDRYSGREFVSVSDKQLNFSQLSRVKFYHFFAGRRNLFNRICTKSESLIQNKLGVNRLKDLEVYRGAQWFSITFEFAEYIVSEKDFIYKQFKNTLIPDEFFVQTLLMNSKFKDNLFYFGEKENIGDMRYIDWNRGHPYTFKSEDYDELTSSNCLFARKFSNEVDSEIVEKLYERLLK